MSATTSDNDSDSEVPHPFYTETRRKSYNSQHDVAEAWASGKYPTHNTAINSKNQQYAVLYTGSPQTADAWGRRSSEIDGESTNFYGTQQSDGSGTLWHYNTREAIRLPDGTIVSNQQCWSGGFAHCTVPGDTKYKIPFDALEELLDEHDTVSDLVNVRGQGEEKEWPHGKYYSRQTRNSIAIIDGENERYGVFFGRDRSIINGNSSFAFRLSDTELRSDATDTIEDIPDTLLRPDAVEESDLPVVDSREYTKTRLSGAELDRHLEAGGTTTAVTRKWLDDYEANRQHYRADLQGNVIVRHGEHFLIPRPDLEPEEMGHRYAAAQMGSHRAERFRGARSPMPEMCSNCGSSSFEVGFENPRYGEEYVSDITCGDCGNEVERPIYVHGEIRHTDNDHNAVNIGDTWHEAVEHGRDVLMYDDNPATGGSGGWD